MILPAEIVDYTFRFEGYLFTCPTDLSLCEQTDREIYTMDIWKIYKTTIFVTYTDT